MTRTVLVTGGAGYIGSHTCKALRLAGYTPVAYDNLCRGHQWAVKWGPLEEGDTRDTARLREVLERHRPEAVLHFAAFTYVGESVEAPLLYAANNVAGTVSLLEACREAGVRRFVLSSTAAVYGTPEQVPIPEDHPRRPVNPYGRTKAFLEDLLEDAWRAHGLAAISLRYFNAAGADEDADTGEAHEPETHLIPLALDAARGAHPRLILFGDDYDTPDGTCIRDYIHVSDLAEAHVLALKSLEKAPRCEAYNLGLGQGFSVKEVIRAAAEVTGMPIPVEVGGRRPGDPPVLVADPSRARRDLGWTPRFQDLHAILETAWRWILLRP
ncbi:MAG: UDP-glucose 4-epimerase GalE [Acidobacteriota bacterium]